jgi:hypothetical protein
MLCPLPAGLRSEDAHPPPVIEFAGPTIPPSQLIIIIAEYR